MELGARAAVVQQLLRVGVAPRCELPALGTLEGEGKGRWGRVYKALRMMSGQGKKHSLLP